jgi:threonine synthase
MSRTRPSSPVVSLATAHPAKFGTAIEKALGFAADLPARLSNISTREERFTVLPNDQVAVEKFIATHCGNRRPARRSAS